MAEICNCFSLYFRLNSRRLSRIPHRLLLLVEINFCWICFIWMYLCANSWGQPFTDNGESVMLLKSFLIFIFQREKQCAQQRKKKQLLNWPHSVWCFCRSVHIFSFEISTYWLHWRQTSRHVWPEEVWLQQTEKFYGGNGFPQIHTHRKQSFINICKINKATRGDVTNTQIE